MAFVCPGPCGYPDCPSGCADDEPDPLAAVDGGRLTSLPAPVEASPEEKAYEELLLRDPGLPARIAARKAALVADMERHARWEYPKVPDVDCHECRDTGACPCGKEPESPLSGLEAKWRSLARAGGDYPSSFGVTPDGRFWLRNRASIGTELFDTLADLIQKILDHPEP